MYNNEPGAQSDPTLGYTFQNDFLALSQAFSGDAANLLI